MNTLVALCLVIIVYNAYGAAHEEPEPEKFYIFNITKQSPFYIRLREEKKPHTPLEAAGINLATLLPNIYTLPKTACFEVVHSLKSSKLKLRVWPEEAPLDPTVSQAEASAFAGKVIPPGGNILMIGYASEEQQSSAEHALSAKGYRVRSKCIPKQPGTPSNDYLWIYRTNAPDITTFIKDLSDAIQPASLFCIAGELRKPIEEAEILAAVFSERLTGLLSE